MVKRAKRKANKFFKTQTNGKRAVNIPLKTPEVRAQEAKDGHFQRMEELARFCNSFANELGEAGISQKVVNRNILDGMRKLANSLAYLLAK